VKGTIQFHYDIVNDVVVAVPRWKVETPEDVLEWFRQYETYMKFFRRKMDMIMVLDHFELAPAVGVLWGEYRGRVLQTFTRHSYRVHANNRVKLYVNTSGARYNTATQEADSVDDAILGIKAARVTSLAAG